MVDGVVANRVSIKKRTSRTEVEGEKKSSSLPMVIASAELEDRLTVRMRREIDEW